MGIQFLRAALENVHAPGPAETSPGSSDITPCSCMPWVPPSPPSAKRFFFFQQPESLQTCGALREYQPVGWRQAVSRSSGGAWKGEAERGNGREPRVSILHQATESLCDWSYKMWKWYVKASSGTVIPGLTQLMHNSLSKLHLEKWPDPKIHLLSQKFKRLSQHTTRILHAFPPDFNVIFFSCWSEKLRYQ